MASKLVKMLADVYPYCKGDVVKLEQDVLTQIDKVAKFRKITQAYEDYSETAASAEKDVDTTKADVEAEVAEVKKGVTAVTAKATKSAKSDVAKATNTTSASSTGTSAV